MYEYAPVQTYDIVASWRKGIKVPDALTLRTDLCFVLGVRNEIQQRRSVPNNKSG